MSLSSAETPGGRNYFTGVRDSYFLKVDNTCEAVKFSFFSLSGVRTHSIDTFTIGSSTVFKIGVGVFVLHPVGTFYED